VAHAIANRVGCQAIQQKDHLDVRKLVEAWGAIRFALLGIKLDRRSPAGPAIVGGLLDRRTHEADRSDRVRSFGQSLSPSN
jgi:hypothetical protein